MTILWMRFIESRPVSVLTNFVKALIAPSSTESFIHRQVTLVWCVGPQTPVRSLTTPSKNLDSLAALYLMTRPNNHAMNVNKAS